MERKDTGLKDIDGNAIFTGDIVEWFFDDDLGYSKTGGGDYAQMLDVVNEINGEIYFVCVVGGSFAWRAVDYCRVVGRVVDDVAVMQNGETFCTKVELFDNGWRAVVIDEVILGDKIRC